MIDRDQLLSLGKRLPSEMVDIPQLGGAIRVQGLTAKAQMEIVKLAGKSSEAEFSAKLLLVCMIREDGTPYLEKDDMDIILSWPAEVFHKLAAAAFRVNGLAGQEEGNSEETDGGAFSIVSRAS